VPDGWNPSYADVKSVKSATGRGRPAA